MPHLGSSMPLTMPIRFGLVRLAAAGVAGAGQAGTANLSSADPTAVGLASAGIAAAGQAGAANLRTSTQPAVGLAAAGLPGAGQAGTGNLARSVDPVAVSLAAAGLPGAGEAGAVNLRRSTQVAVGLAGAGTAGAGQEGTVGLSRSVDPAAVGLAADGVAGAGQAGAVDLSRSADPDTLALSDFDADGLDVEMTALIEAGMNGQSGGLSFYTAAGAPWAQSGTLLDGDVTVSGDDGPLRRFMVTPEAAPHVIFRMNGSDSTFNLGGYFAPAGAGNDLSLYIQTEDDGVESMALAGAIHSSGGNWINISMAANVAAQIGLIAPGERVIIALARVEAVGLAADGVAGAGQAGAVDLSRSADPTGVGLAAAGVAGVGQAGTVNLRRSVDPAAVGLAAAGVPGSGEAGAASLRTSTTPTVGLAAAGVVGAGQAGAVDLSRSVDPAAVGIAAAGAAGAGQAGEASLRTSTLTTVGLAADGVAGVGQAGAGNLDRSADPAPVGLASAGAAGAAQAGAANLRRSVDPTAVSLAAAGVGGEGQVGAANLSRSVDPAAVGLASIGAAGAGQAGAANLRRSTQATVGLAATGVAGAGQAGAGNLRRSANPATVGLAAAGAPGTGRGGSMNLRSQDLAGAVLIAAAGVAGVGQPGAVRVRTMAAPPDPLTFPGWIFRPRVGGELDFRFPDSSGYALVDVQGDGVPPAEVDWIAEVAAGGEVPALTTYAHRELVLTFDVLGQSVVDLETREEAMFEALRMTPGTGPPLLGELIHVRGDGTRRVLTCGALAGLQSGGRLGLSRRFKVTLAAPHPYWRGPERSESAELLAEEGAPMPLTMPISFGSALLDVDFALDYAGSAVTTSLEIEVAGPAENVSVVGPNGETIDATIVLLDGNVLLIRMGGDDGFTVELDGVTNLNTLAVGFTPILLRPGAVQVRVGTDAGNGIVTARWQDEFLSA